MGADFDGDVLNTRLIINKKFLNYANKVFNPRNAMFISRNDGLFNNDMNHARDTIININTLLRQFRKGYTQANVDKIKRFQQLQ